MKVVENVNRALMEAKAKVATVKSMFIPQLELVATKLGARLADTTKNYASLKMDKIFFWVDSKAVLNWINMDAKSNC